MKYIIAKSTKKLSVVAVPIGNLSEITARAITALREADVIFCEDTRVTGMLLRHLKIVKKELVSLHLHNEASRITVALKCLDDKKRCVLVSDAGYPSFCDPGETLIEACYKNNIPIEVINGPSPIIHALLASGFSTQRFVFIGFIEPKGHARDVMLTEAATYPFPSIIFEAPHRIIRLLEEINRNYPKMQIAVCRELTKLHETIYRGVAQEILDEIVPRGEFVVILSGSAVESSLTLSAVIAKAKMLTDRGMRKKEAAKMAVEGTDFNASSIYESLSPKKGGDQ